MSAQTLLNAMRTAQTAIHAAQCQPTMVAEIIRCGLAEQFRLAGELLDGEIHDEVQRLMAACGDDPMPTKRYVGLGGQERGE